MAKPISFFRYRAMDIAMFTLLLCISETLIVLGSTVWFEKEPYTLSLTPAVSAIVMMRWGLPAAMPAAAGAAALCFFSGAQSVQYLVYMAGNLCFIALYPVFVSKKRWQKTRENVLRCMLYGFLCALSMQIGRGAIALVTGHGFKMATGFITTDALSAMFSVLIVWICRRLDGMLEDQKHYLFRIQKEEQKKKGE